MGVSEFTRKDHRHTREEMLTPENMSDRTMLRMASEHPEGRATVARRMQRSVHMVTEEGVKAGDAGVGFWDTAQALGKSPLLQVHEALGAPDSLFYEYLYGFAFVYRSSWDQTWSLVYDRQALHH